MHLWKLPEAYGTIHLWDSGNYFTTIIFVNSLMRQLTSQAKIWTVLSKHLHILFISIFYSFIQANFSVRTYLPQKNITAIFSTRCYILPSFPTLILFLMIKSYQEYPWVLELNPVLNENKREGNDPNYWETPLEKDDYYWIKEMG